MFDAEAGTVAPTSDLRNQAAETTALELDFGSEVRYRAAAAALSWGVVV